MDAVSTHEAVAVAPASQDDRLARLFDAHYERLYRLARRLSPSADDALDLVQDTFVRVAGMQRHLPVGERAEEVPVGRATAEVSRHARSRLLRRQGRPARVALRGYHVGTWSCFNTKSLGALRDTRS